MKAKKINRKRLILAAIVILIIGVFVIRAHQSGSKGPTPQTDTVKRGTVMASVSGNGVLQPLTTVEVRSNVGGTVVQLAVDEGDRVKAGQLICKIDPSDSISALEQARADYSSSGAKVAQSKQALSMQRLQTSAGIISAEQAVEASRQKLAESQQEAALQPRLTREAISQAKSSLESAEASLTQTTSALTPQKLASAKAAYDQAKASYDENERTLKRQLALLDKGFVSQSQVDSAQAQFDTSKAQLESAKSKFDTVKDESDQDLKSAKSKVAQAKSALAAAEANRVQDTIKVKELAAARASLKQAVASLATARSSAYQDQMKSGDILQAKAQMAKSEAALENAQTQVGYTTITAPCSGVVVAKYVEKGSIVTAGRQAIGGSSGAGITVVEIADTSKMQVVVDVDETDVSKIRLGQEVDVKVDALPDELFPAKVTKIAPKAEVNQNVTTVPVTVQLAHADSRLKPQMNATCDFVINRKENVLYIPVEALTETDSGDEVTIVDHDKQVVRKIKVGLSGDDYCEIVSGLKEGDTVIIPEDDTTTKTSSSSNAGGGPPPPM